MTPVAPVRLARLADAPAIATMSRDYIEQGLGWSWTVGRVERAIRDPDINVAVMGEPGALQGFGIMSYREKVAHLLLFAVSRSHQRKGLGSAILAWLETVAVDAGITHINVECRRDNSAARNFYGEHGYYEQVISKRYYSGIEDAVRLEKWLTGTASG